VIPAGEFVLRDEGTKTNGVRYGGLDEIARYRGNSGGTVHDVATKAPNDEPDDAVVPAQDDETDDQD